MESETRMRLAFFGSGDFGVPTLEALAATGAVVAAVSQPDRCAGRGGKCRATAITQKALELDLPVLKPESPNTPEFVAETAALDLDLAVVVAYGHLIKPPLLTTPRLGFVNLHASLLPAYRGAAPVPWALLKGETASGVTVFTLDERFDTGGILARAEEPIAPDDTAGSYLRKLAPLGARLMAAVVPEFLAGNLSPQAQDNANASRAPKFKKEDARVEWSKPFAVLEREVRAYQPWPLSFATLPTAKGEVRVNLLSLAPSDFSPGESTPPGAVLCADQKHGLVVMTGDMPARMECFQPEGKRPMRDIDFLRGTSIQL